MICLCAWHKIHFPNEEPPELSRCNSNPGTVSHGICKRCSEKVRKEWAESGKTKRIVAAGYRQGVKE